MVLLLTLLSVFAAWTLLSVLIFGLLLILKPLQSIRGQLERIAMGVRAIERQTLPLGARAAILIDSLDRLGEAAGSAGDRLGQVGADLEQAAPALLGGARTRETGRRQA